ncbi:unnamed protein product [Soboliphyme baturini]|uniref:C2H2-type domain-containing protein n=1 Tax=Soboliphyme baturini TaxID=241478 RepID=A0A183IZW5_9BILA|nr:unnamed protein product [Soboliphyme baturini]
MDDETEEISAGSSSDSKNDVVLSMFRMADADGAVRPLRGFTVLIGDHKIKLKIVQAHDVAMSAMTKGTGNIHRDPEEGEVVCMFCGYCFDSADELASHEPLCAAGEAEPCSLTCNCGRSFAHPSTLHEHQQTHESPMGGDFPCHYCSRTFASSTLLATHETIHSVLKFYKCGFCPKSFQRKVHM